MEDALRDVVRLRRRGGYPVLILVLMEDALRGQKGQRAVQANAVLILVLMEDALREVQNAPNTIIGSCLNPCSNGRCSARAKFKTC